MAKVEQQKWTEKTVAVKKCRCPHGDQDKRYGKKMRLHNRTKQSDDQHNKGWRCTVCKDVKA